MPDHGRGNCQDGHVGRDVERRQGLEVLSTEDALLPRQRADGPVLVKWPACRADGYDQGDPGHAAEHEEEVEGPLLGQAQGEPAVEEQDAELEDPDEAGVRVPGHKLHLAAHFEDAYVCVAERVDLVGCYIDIASGEIGEVSHGGIDRVQTERLC